MRKKTLILINITILLAIAAILSGVYYKYGRAIFDVDYKTSIVDSICDFSNMPEEFKLAGVMPSELSSETTAIFFDKKNSGTIFISQHFLRSHEVSSIFQGQEVKVDLADYITIGFDYARERICVEQEPNFIAEGMLKASQQEMYYVVGKYEIEGVKKKAASFVFDHKNGEGQKITALTFDYPQEKFDFDRVTSFIKSLKFKRD